MSPLDKLEKLLHDTLHKVGGEFHPSDPAAARERFLASRRRRRLYALGESVAAVGMAALAVVFIARANIGSETVIESATQQPRVVATIETSADPVAVAVGEGAVWMTDSEGGSIKKIDPTTNEEIDSIPISGDPDEVLAAGGYVWATNTNGQIIRIEPDSGELEMTPRLISAEGIVHFDIALTSETLYVIDPARQISFTIDVDTTEVLPLGTAGFNDMAADGDQVWAYSASNGQLAPANKDELIAAEVIDVPKGDDNSDLAVGFGAAWISTGAEGKVYRIDLETGDQLDAEIGGRYADLSIDVTDDAVWALAIDDEAGTSEVFELDQVTAEIVSDPIQLPGVASDMSVGEGSVWVPDEDGKVRRISSEAVSPPAPDESADAFTELPDDQLLYVFVRDDDLWARYVGDDVQLTDTPEIESSPTVSADGGTVAFVRRPNTADRDGRADIFELDLDAGGGPTLVAEGGTEPAYGPNGELAWLVPPGGILPSNRAPALMPWASFRIADRAPQSFELFDVWQQGQQVTELAWDQTSSQLYIETTYEGKAVHTIDVEIGENGRVQMSPAEVVLPEDRDEGGVYQAPSGPVAPLVVHSCCVFTEGDQATTFDLGHAIITAEGTRYDGIATLERLDIKPGADVETASIDWTTADGVEIVPAEDGIYLVFDGDAVWIVDATGPPFLFDIDITGIAAPFMKTF